MCCLLCRQPCGAVGAGDSRPEGQTGGGGGAGERSHQAALAATQLGDDVLCPPHRTAAETGPLAQPNHESDRPEQTHSHVS